MSGLGIGLLGASLLVAVGFARALVGLVRGSSVAVGPEDLALVIWYVAGGGAAGLIAGLLFPVARSKPGAILVGAVALQPLLLAILFVEGYDWLTWVIMTAVFGPVVGIAWVHRWHRDP